MSGPMLWLQNCLNRTAEDREEDGKSNCQTKNKSINQAFNMLCFFTLLQVVLALREVTACVENMYLVLFGLLMK